MNIVFKFDIKKAEIFLALKWQRNLFFRWAGPLKKVFLFIFLPIFLLFLYGFFFTDFAIPTLSRILGFSIISATLCLIFWELETFLNLKLKKPRPKFTYQEALAHPDKINLADFLNFDVASAAYKALKFAGSKNLPEINSSILFYFILSGADYINFIFSRAILDLAGIRKMLEQYLKTLLSSSAGESGGKFKENYTEDFQKNIFTSFKIAEEKKHKLVEAGDVLTALAEHDPLFKKILVDSGLKAEDIGNLVNWTEYIKERAQGRKKFWRYKNLAKHGSLARQWASGYTITLDQFSIDWTDLIRERGFAEIIGHENEIFQTERILARTDINNPLIVGEPGTGRGSIIQALAQKCLFGESLSSLNYMRVVELDVLALLAKIDSPEEVEMVLDKIFGQAAAAGNIILVINEFHNFIGQLVRPGIVDISGVLAPYLKSPNFQIVAVTTYAGLHKYIEQDPSILSLFEKVEVTEISDQETILLLENMALFFEQKYKKEVTYPALRDIVLYSKKYLPDVSFPKKALDLLDEIMVYVNQSTNDKLILPKHVAKVISDKTQIPVGDVNEREKEILLNLEDLVHKRIINQEEAVSEISTAIRRARAQVTIRKGPMGAFLFLGPTGVGKTETSKALSEIYFRSEEKMIRLDMSEFQNVADIPRIIGSATQEGIFTTQVRENPFSLILLDEFEKAHPNILNLFLQIFDEGHVTDGLGRKVDFKNCLIIATSNAGYKVILEALKENKDMAEIKNQLLDFLFKEGVFRPELINRFDAVVIFKSLSKENLLGIADLLLGKLKQNLDDKGIEFKITKPLKEKIVELSYNPVFGAREMRRVIQDKIENVLAVSLLSGQVKRGDRVEMDPENFKIRLYKD